MSMKRKNGDMPYEGYICNACGSSDHFKTSDRCPAKDEICRYCKEMGHIIEMCFKRIKKNALKQRCDQIQSTHKRPSENSSEALLKRPKQ